MAGERSTSEREDKFFQILFGKPEGTIILGTPRQWWGYNIKTNIKYTEDRGYVSCGL
jgi:hypothetical protein